MTLKAYIRLERSEERVKPGLTELGELAPHEYYYLLRRRAGISQPDIADRMGVSKAYISQAELGHQPPEVLERFWKAYHADN